MSKNNIILIGMPGSGKSRDRADSVLCKGRICTTEYL